MGQGGGRGPGDAGRETGCMGQATSSQLLSQVWGGGFRVTWFVRHRLPGTAPQALKAQPCCRSRPGLSGSRSAGIPGRCCWRPAGMGGSRSRCGRPGSRPS